MNRQENIKQCKKVTPPKKPGGLPWTIHMCYETADTAALEASRTRISVCSADCVGMFKAVNSQPESWLGLCNRINTIQCWTGYWILHAHFPDLIYNYCLIRYALTSWQIMYLHLLSTTHHSSGFISLFYCYPKWHNTFRTKKNSFWGKWKLQTI